MYLCPVSSQTLYYVHKRALKQRDPVVWVVKIIEQTCKKRQVEQAHGNM